MTVVIPPVDPANGCARDRRASRTDRAHVTGNKIVGIEIGEVVGDGLNPATVGLQCICGRVDKM